MEKVKHYLCRKIQLFSYNETLRVQVPYCGIKDENFENRTRSDQQFRLSNKKQFIKSNNIAGLMSFSSGTRFLIKNTRFRHS